MNISVPPEFEALARERVRAGTVASEEEAAVRVLRDYAAHVETVRTLLDPALSEIDRGDTIDGDEFMRRLIEETRLKSGA